MAEDDDIPPDGFISIEEYQEQILHQPWYLLGQPWAHSDLAGMTILAGNEDPHKGTVVCDTQDICGDYYDDDVARAVAEHVVELHNAWLEAQS